jgi:HCOMODA/2-hydroxy-3-carboxy-muconic semialdehyde decarboxylase
MEFTLEGDPIDAKDRKPYLERFIHGAIYEARPDVVSVVHNHSPSTIPFGVTGKRMKPLLHMCASIGHDVPLWDSHDKFGNTALLVSDMKMGRDLAKRLAKGRTALMRGHGAVIAGFSIRHAVYVSIYLELNAKLQMQAMQMGKIKFLYKGEVDAVIARTGAYGINRAWENWCRRAGREMQGE